MELNPPNRESYDPAFFETLFKAEDHHFWFRARNRIIGRVLKGIIAGFSPGYRVLEVGCGTGNVLRILESECTKGSVVGMDLYDEGLRLARQRTTCPLIVGDIHQPPFTHQFDLVCLFDVLEHLEDDLRVLQSLNRLLTPGRILLLTVPAHNSLWSYFDVAAHHCRRYSPSQLRGRLIEAGFEIIHISQFMMALFPLVWLGRRSRRTALTPKDNHELAIRELRIVPVVNPILTWLLSWEANWIANSRHLPFGTSLIAWVRKC